MDERLIGVEEELLVVDPSTGEPVPDAARVLRHDPRQHSHRADAAEGELMREMVETQTQPRGSLVDLRAQILAERATVASMARAADLMVVPLATSPLPTRPTTTPDRRYDALVERFGATATEQLACGYHVHVSTASRDEAVEVIDRVRPWLSVLLALSANSPYWQGEDTGYASFRERVWSRWPSSGPTDIFGSVTAYDEVVRTLVATGVALDKRATYFEARVGVEAPTVEVRVADVCLEPDDAVLVAALTRGLVATAAAEAQAGRPVPDVRTSVLRGAAWRAGRYGVTGELVDPVNGRTVSVRERVDSLVEHVRAALDAYGDVGLVEASLARVLSRGTGSDRQRAAATGGQLTEVVRMAGEVMDAD